MDEAGMWPYMEEWKRRVVLMNEQIAAAYHTSPYTIWDFGGFNEYSTEKAWDQLPQGQSMLWYEDIVHFQGELGAKMLSAMRDQQTRGDWFEVVNSGNMEQHLEKIRQQRDRYKASHIKKPRIQMQDEE
jgi:hypothetical protein